MRIIYCLLSLFLSIIIVFFFSCSQREIEILKEDDVGWLDADEDISSENELIKYVRISVSDTKTWGAFGWVREAEDSIFTVRDDVSTTCYKGPENKEVLITLDIFTVFKKGLPLKRLDLKHNQLDKIDFDISLLDNCQSNEVFSFNTKFYKPLELDNRLAGCVKIRFKSIKGLEICSISLISSETVKPSSSEPLQGQRDKKSGVIEGFYGVMWSDSEREKLIQTLAKYQLGMYVYAPKNEPKHRERWREDYTDEEMIRFSELNKKTNKYGVDFYYAISPFIDFEYGDSKDFDILLTKLERFSKYGFKNFAIFADDIELEKEIRVNAELGRIHTMITNSVFDSLKPKLPDVKMLFVGTVYSDERASYFEDEYGYLKEISNLNPEIDIFWTGRKTSGAIINEEDVRLFTEVTGRKPLIWDNFWANDGGDGFLASLYLSDYTGRSFDLKNYVNGIAINPLIQGSLSRLNLMRFGGWMLNSTSNNWAYNELDWFGYYCNNCDFDYTIKNLILLTNIYNGNSNQTIQYHELEKALDSLYEAFRLEDMTAIIERIRSLFRIFAKMFVLQRVLYNTNIDAELFDEIFFPSEKIRLDALTGIYALQFLVSKLNGTPDYTLERKMKSSLERANAQRFIYSAGKLNRFVDFVSNISINNSYKIETPLIKERIPQRCDSRTEFFLEPFEEIENIEIYGLPQRYFMIEKGRIRLNISFAGNYSIAIIGHTREGVDILFGDILCK